MKKIIYMIIAIISITLLVSCTPKTTGAAVTLPVVTSSENTTTSSSDSPPAGPDILVKTPMTVSLTDLFPVSQKHEYLMLQMVKGTYTEELQPEALPVPTWQGYFALQLVESTGKILSKKDLSKTYERTLIDVNGNSSTDTEILEFKGSFEFKFGDYNNDGDLDFTLGQHASSNGNVYKIFTIRKNNEIEELKIKDNPELYITGGEPYSAALEKADTATFKIKQFYPGGTTRDLFFKWSGSEFVLQSSQNANGAESTAITLDSLNMALPQNWKLDTSSSNILNFVNDKSEIAGFISINEYDSSYDLMSQKPNHSSVAGDESFDVALGSCRLLTLDADNGSAASGKTGTHNEYYASVTIKDKAILVLSFNKNDKSKETKKEFINLLKSIQLK